MVNYCKFTFYNKKLIKFMHVLLACVYIYHKHVSNLLRSEDSNRSFGTRVPNAYEIQSGWV